MGIYDRIMCIPAYNSLGDGKGKDIKDAVVISGDQAARHYFEETDQEMWNISKDFPDITPIFENFFVETLSPKKIVSEVSGITPWDPQMPSSWGVWFVSLDINKITQIDKKTVHQHLVPQIEAMEQTMMPILEKALQKSNMDYAKAWSSLSKAEIESMQILKEMISSLAGDPSDEIREAERRGIKWVTEAILFLDMNNKIVPVWTWKLSIKRDGSIFETADGRSGLSMPTPWSAELYPQLTPNAAKDISDFLESFFYSSLLSVYQSNLQRGVKNC